MDDTLTKASLLTKIIAGKIIAGNPDVWDLVMQSNMSNEKDMELHFQVQAYVRTHA